MKKKKDKQGDGSKSETSSASVAVSDDDSGELLVASADLSSVGHCASNASTGCDMSFSTG